MPATVPDVLIIEDDDDLRQALADALLDGGYQVATATNGREALARLEAGLSPQLILVDLMMPIMNGWTFIEHLRSSPATSSIPAIVLTAAGPYWGWPESARRVLHKPVGATDVLTVVREVLLAKRVAADKTAELGMTVALTTSPSSGGS
jgi:CheY-like chemotaxis protein